MKEKLKAAIFDVDGLILDSETFYAKAWADAFNENCRLEDRIDEEVMIEWFYNNLSGKKIGQQLDNIQSKFQNANIPKIYEEYRKLFSARLKTESIDVRKGFFDLLKYLKKNNIRLAIASTSNINTIKTCFVNSKIDINDFEVVVSGDMGLEYKPSPQPYLKACQILNVDPKDAIAFEDSNSGVLSATNAQIKCFLIPGRAPIKRKTEIIAFAKCDNLEDAITVIQEFFMS